MKMTICVLTDSPNLYNKIRLLLRATHEVVLVGDKESVGDYSLVIRDTDAFPDISCLSEITVGDGGDLPHIFRHEDLLLAIESFSASGKDVLRLSENGCYAEFSGERIKLTDLEFRLLSVLIERDGFVSRDELMSSLWNNECDDGALNVYIYYLRRKLEKNGSKVIISSRMGGYKIDEKYRRHKRC